MIEREAYHLLPTLARDLSDHYPAFKIALGDAIRNNAAVRNNKDYPTLFESLLLNPLKIGPIVVVIGTLDDNLQEAYIPSLLIAYANFHV